MQKKYDLRDRTYKFAVEIVKFCLPLFKNIELRELGRQLIKSGTSVGANVEEGDGARTRKEFGNKMTISRNEAKETRFWLRVIMDSEVLHNKTNIEKAKKLLNESEELIRILSSIIEKVK
ncbi:MAG: four helix bundle protein [Candidatus Margulisiibacteriota bacterium]